MGIPLVGFGPPTRCFPNPPPTASQPRAPLLGFHCPYSAKGRKSPRPSGCPVRLPGFAGNASAGPTLPTTVPPSGFPNLSAALFLSRPPCHFQTGCALGVSPFRGLILSRRPDNSSPSACPLDVPPAGCACPRPRRGHLQARDPVPRMYDTAPLLVFRAFVRVKIGLVTKPLLMSS